jgi:NCS2 family nucleobase:cation symporter-2
VKRPVHIAHWVDETPPRGVTLLSGLQHVGIISIALIYPLLLGREAGLSEAGTADLVAVSMLVLGIAALLQSLPRGPIGARLLCPPVCTAAYLTPALIAVKTGGLPLAFGMTVFGGFIEIALSRVLRPLRPYLPPELSGLVVLLVAVSVGNLGFHSLLGIGAARPPDAREFIVAALTLATMLGLSVWSRGAARLFCVLIGMMVGYVAASMAGIMAIADLEALNQAALVSMPRLAAHEWRWDTALAIPFAIAALGTAIRGVGDITIAQKINDTDWVRPEMRSVSGGVLANGIANVLGGLLGAHGVSTYTSSVGLSAASGVTSRRVGYAIGAIFLLLAFMPKASALFLIMPRPVIGAATLFTAAIIFVNGVQIVASRLMDARRTFVIGLSFISGLAVDVYPGYFQGLPQGVLPIFASSLVLGTVAALVLNLLARIGMRRTQRLVVEPARVDPAVIESFMEIQGAAWGARRDVVDRASFSLTQSIETIVEACAPASALEIEATFDEFNLDLRVSYDGPPLELPQLRPTNEEILSSEEGERRLAGFMLRRHADRVAATCKGGRTSVLFHFDH